jgi:hypothetical protein
MSADIIPRLEKFYNEGLGKRATRTLRNGACMELQIDREAYSFQKVNGKMQINKGVPPKRDVVVQFKKDALERMLTAVDEDELRRRLVDSVRKMEIMFVPFLVPPKKGTEGMNKEEMQLYAVQWLAWNGYIFWARRMRFI